MPSLYKLCLYCINRLESNKLGSLICFGPCGLHYDIVCETNAVLCLLQNSEDWPVVDPLPSYGRGRELPGGRHRSLIYGCNLTDVIITGRYYSMKNEELYSIVLYNCFFYIFGDI